MRRPGQFAIRALGKSQLPTVGWVIRCAPCIDCGRAEGSMDASLFTHQCMCLRQRRRPRARCARRNYICLLEDFRVSRSASPCNSALILTGHVFNSEEQRKEQNGVSTFYKLLDRVYLCAEFYLRLIVCDFTFTTSFPDIQHIMLQYYMDTMTDRKWTIISVCFFCKMVIRSTFLHRRIVQHAASSFLQLVEKLLTLLSTAKLILSPQQLSKTHFNDFVESVFFFHKKKRILTSYWPTLTTLQNYNVHGFDWIIDFYIQYVVRVLWTYIYLRWNIHVIIKSMVSNFLCAFVTSFSSNVILS